MTKEMQWKKSHVDFFVEFSQCILLSLVLSRWRHAVDYKNDQFLKCAQKIFIFGQKLEKFAQKTKCGQILEKFTQFSKVANTYSPASILNINVEAIWPWHLELPWWPWPSSVYQTWYPNTDYIALKFKSF